MSQKVPSPAQLQMALALRKQGLSDEEIIARIDSGQLTPQQDDFTRKEDQKDTMGNFFGGVLKSGVNTAQGIYDALSNPGEALSNLPDAYQQGWSKSAQGFRDAVNSDRGLLDKTFDVGGRILAAPVDLAFAGAGSALIDQGQKGAENRDMGQVGEAVGGAAQMFLPTSIGRHPKVLNRLQKKPDPTAAPVPKPDTLGDLHPALKAELEGLSSQKFEQRSALPGRSSFSRNLGPVNSPRTERGRYRDMFAREQSRLVEQGLLPIQKALAAPRSRKPNAKPKPKTNKK